MKCPNCGSDNAAGARFCYNCGASIAVADSPAPMNLDKKPDSPRPPADQPIERTVVMSLPPNLFNQPPPPMPPAGGETRFDAPNAAGATQFDATMPPMGPVDTAALRVNTAPLPPPRATGAAKNSGMAIAALVAGILSLPCGFVVLLPIVAIILGFMARSQIAKSYGMLKGNGLAMVGIILGIVSLLFVIIGYAAFGLSLAGSLSGG